MSPNLKRIPECQVSWKSIQQFPNFMRTDVWTDMLIGAPQVCQRARNWLYKNCSYAYDVSLSPYQAARGSLSSNQRGIEIRVAATLQRNTTLRKLS
jgi:hypothetical protein